MALRKSDSAEADVALGCSDQRDIVQRRRGHRVSLAASLAMHLERLPKQRLGALEVAFQAKNRRKVTQADGGFSVFVAERIAPDRQCFAVKRLGTLVESLILVDAAELGKRVGDIRVLRTIDSAAYAQRRLEACGRRFVVALFGRQRAEIVERLCHTRVLRPERRPSGDERSFEQVLCLVVDAEAAVHPSDDRENLGLRLGLVHELFLHPLGGGIEQPAERQSVRRGAVRNWIGAHQQSGERFAHSGRLHRLSLRAVALRRDRAV